MSPPGCIARLFNRHNDIVGAGVLALKDHVVTCTHVVQEALAPEPIKLGALLDLDFPFAGIKSLPARVVAFEPAPNGALDGHGADVAVLAIDASKLALLPCIPNKDKARPDTRFSAFGFPRGQANGTLAEGVIVGVDAGDWIAVTAESSFGDFIAPGFSGTPIFEGQRRDLKCDQFLGLAVTALADPALKAGRLIPSHVIGRVLRGVPAATPFRNLRHFDAQDTAFFHGRKEFCRKVLSDRRRHHFFVLAGPAGCGKSSILRAGFIPALRAEKKMNTVLIPRCREPVADIARALQIDPASTSTLSEDVFKELYRRAKDPRYQGLLLLVDQLEDMFPTSDPNGGNGGALDFLTLLQRMMGTEGNPFQIILAIRWDFLTRLLNVAPRAIREKIERTFASVLPMDEGNLVAAIRSPAQHFDVAFDDGLAERIAADALRLQAPVAMLQIVLDALWPGDPDGRISEADYEALQGDAPTGIEGALARFADRALQQLAPGERDLLRAAMIELVDTSASRGRAQKLARFSTTQQEILQKFEHTRLISIHDSNDGQVVELGHDSLIAVWKSLQSWLQKTRSFRAWRDDMRGRLKTSYNPGQILAGEQLEMAKAMRAQYPVELQGDAQLLALIDESERAARQLAEESERQRRDAEARIRAERDRALRMQSLFLAAESTRVLQEGDSGTALLLALHALPADAADPRPATKAAYRSLRAAYIQYNERAVLGGHGGPIRCARFDQRGSSVLTGGTDGAVLSWHMTPGAGAPRRLLQLPAPVRQLWLARDGTRLLAASTDGDIAMHDLQAAAACATFGAQVDRDARVYYNGAGADAVVVRPGAARPAFLIARPAWAHPGRRTRHWLPASPITAFAWQAAAHCWISGHEDGSLALWDAVTLEPCMPAVSSADGAAPPVAWLACAALQPVLLACDSDGTMAKWRIARAARHGGGTAWKMAREGGICEGVIRVSVNASGSTAIVLTARNGKCVLRCIGRTAYWHDLGTVWECDVSRLLLRQPPHATDFSDAILRMGRNGKDAFLALDKRLFHLSLDDPDTFRPIAVFRGAVRQVSMHPEQACLVAASDDGTVRVLALQPDADAAAAALDQHTLLASASARVARDLTTAQRVEHYLDDGAAFSVVDETVPIRYNGAAAGVPR